MALSAPFVDGEAQHQLLREGRIKPRGLMPDCSNYTYLAQVRGPDGAETLAVYKPGPGETPLDDFPDGTLGKREVAAYLVSDALRWQVVPFTVYRANGPLGPGSLQQFIVADLREHYFSLMPARAAALSTMSGFQPSVNTAARRSGLFPVARPDRCRTEPVTGGGRLPPAARRRAGATRPVRWAEGPEAPAPDPPNPAVPAAEPASARG